MVQAVCGVAGLSVVAGCTDGTGEGDEVPEDEQEGIDDVIEEDTDLPAEEWEDVDTIELEAEDDGWTGREPPPIEGEQNPPLLLYAGREYEFTWENTDGDVHNFAIWDDDGTPIDSTEFVEDEGETESLVVETTEEMAAYVCETHDVEMAAPLEIHTE